MTRARSGWREARLGEFARVDHGWPFKSEFYTSDPSAPVVISIGNFDYGGGFRFDRSLNKRYSAEYPVEYELSPGDLLVVMTCQTEGGEILGVPGIVPDDGRTYLHNQRIGKVVIFQPDLIDRDYLFHVARSPDFNRQLFVTASGSKILHTSPERLGRVSINLPSLAEQRAIAEVLGALDDKIAANSSLVARADEWVRAIWADLDLRTNDAVTVGEISANVRDHVDPSRLARETVHVGLEHIPRRNMWLTRHGDAHGLGSAKAEFQHGDVLFGKLRPYFHKVVGARCSGVCSTDVLVVRPIDPAIGGFVLAALASDPVVDACVAASEGTRMPRASWKDLGKVEVPWPGMETAQAFSARVEAIADRVDAAVRENSVLEATRDALLPALMSGTLRVRDAIDLVEETAT